MNYFLLTLIAVSSLLLIFFLLQFLIYMIVIPVGAPFVVSDKNKLKDMLSLGNAKQGDKIIDIGCGDGEIISKIAEKGFMVDGIEINPFLVKKCKKRIKKNNLEELVKVKKGDLWKENFSDYDLIFVYGISHIMEKLESKLLNELKPGTRVVSNYFKFPNWSPVAIKNDVRLYVVDKK